MHQAFLGILKETEDIAGQHEGISEELQARVYKELQNLHNEAKLERKKVQLHFFTPKIVSVL